MVSSIVPCIGSKNPFTRLLSRKSTVSILSGCYTSQFCYNLSSFLFNYPEDPEIQSLRSSFIIRWLEVDSSISLSLDCKMKTKLTLYCLGLNMKNDTCEILFQLL